MHPRSQLSALAILLTGYLITSCKEDPALVQKHKDQLLELDRLRNELQVIQQEINSIPSDAVIKLKQVETELAQASGEAKEVEEEIRELQQKKIALEKSIEEYRKKYPLK